jgi:hypothetical protein
MTMRFTKNASSGKQVLPQIRVQRTQQQTQQQSWTMFQRVKVTNPKCMSCHGAK